MKVLFAVLFSLLCASCHMFDSGPRWNQSRGKVLEVSWNGQFAIVSEIGMPRILSSDNSATKLVIEPDPEAIRSWRNNYSYTFSAIAAERVIVSSEQELTWRYRTDGRWREILLISVE